MIASASGVSCEMHANHREEVDSVNAGDIVAIIGLKGIFTGDTLCDPEQPIVLESITLPRAGYLGLDRAEDAHRSGQDGRGPLLDWLRRIRPSAFARTRRRVRP